MKVRKPVLLISGASGVVGRNFINSVRDDFKIYALSRWGRLKGWVPQHSNVTWLKVDIANFLPLKILFDDLLNLEKRVDFIVHLASYYDYCNTRHPEYRRTNVWGTRNILEMAKISRVKRFLFTGSLAACSFPKPGGRVNEESPPDASTPYGRSKKEGEILVGDYSAYFPSTIIRPAAVFTDWCEYGCLYVFLCRWLSRRLDARLLPGKGESALPYIHVENLCDFIRQVIEKSSMLGDLDVLIASGDGSTTLQEIFKAATRCFFQKKVKPLLVPKFMAGFAVGCRDLGGCLVGRRPFLRSWMIKYIDKQLQVDASHSREILGWEPKSSLGLIDRMDHLVEKLKRHPAEWHYRNLKSLVRVPSNSWDAGF